MPPGEACRYLIGDPPSGVESDVVSAPVALGPLPVHHTGRLQHIQMMRQQIAGNPQQRRQLAGGGVSRVQGLGDLQPGRVGERLMQPHHLVHGRPWSG